MSKFFQIYATTAAKTAYYVGLEGHVYNLTLASIDYITSGASQEAVRVSIDEFKNKRGNVQDIIFGSGNSVNGFHNDYDISIGDFEGVKNFNVQLSTAASGASLTAPTAFTSIVLTFKYYTLEDEKKIYSHNGW